MFYLITGGSASGKSEYAESIITQHADRKKYYIATMHAFDEESLRRIEKHRRSRSGKGFETIECYLGLKDLILPGEKGEQRAALLECMSNLLANEMYEEEGAKEDALCQILRGVDRLLEQVEDLVVVTNEIFSDLQEYSPETLGYMQTLGKINQQLGERADHVIEVVCGRAVIFK